MKQGTWFVNEEEKTTVGCRHDISQISVCALMPMESGSLGAHLSLRFQVRKAPTVILLHLDDL
jgi:hypothetical protein